MTKPTATADFAKVVRPRAVPRSVEHKLGKEAPVAVAPSPAATRASRSRPRTVAGVWQRLAMCESGGRWQVNTGNGYYGGLQFSLRSWRWVGGSGYPHEATPAEQVLRARLLLARQGWGAWPVCSRKLGLR